MCTHPVEYKYVIPSAMWYTDLPYAIELLRNGLACANVLPILQSHSTVYINEIMDIGQMAQLT